MKRCSLALLLLVLGCHSGTTPPPPPALGSITLRWQDGNPGAPTAPQGNGWLTGYVILRDGVQIASLGPGVTTFTDQTSVGPHTYQVYDSFEYTGPGTVTVLRSTVQENVQ